MKQEQIRIRLPEGHYLFSSESVTEGHPDKICNQISDAILDAILASDPRARVACETVVTTGLVESIIRSKARLTYSKVSRLIDGAADKNEAYRLFMRNSDRRYRTISFLWQSLQKYCEKTDMRQEVLISSLDRKSVV